MTAGHSAMLETQGSPVKDFPLLWKVYDHISEHPEEWRQGYWMTQVYRSCGTAFCFAGHVVHMTVAEYEPAWTLSGVASAVLVNGKPHGIDVLARNALGLSADEATMLFGANNSLSQIRDIIAGWEAEYIVSV